MSATWKILEDMVQKEPERFADLAARCIPKDVALTFEARLLGNLDPADWSVVLEVMDAVKQRHANSRVPGEIMQHVWMRYALTMQR